MSVGNRHSKTDLMIIGSGRAEFQSLFTHQICDFRTTFTSRRRRPNCRWPSLHAFSQSSVKPRTLSTKTI